MPRPHRKRCIRNRPDVRLYKPLGIPAWQLETINLTEDALEALRLADLEGMDQEQAAEKMEISRSTFSRLVKQARHTVAKALVKGMAINIEGGNFSYFISNETEDEKMLNNGQGLGMGRCGRGDRRGKCGRGSGMGKNSGPGYGRERGMGGNYNILNASQKMTNKQKNAEEIKTSNEVTEGEKLMKLIAVSCTGNNLDAQVNPRFGRAESFLLVNPETMDFEYLDNSNVNSMGSGAGIQTAEIMSKNNVGVVLTGSVGPKAATALQAGDIKYLEGYENQTVREAVEKFKSQSF